MRIRVATRSGGNEALTGGGPAGTERRERDERARCRARSRCRPDRGRRRRRQRIRSDGGGERQDARGEEGDTERRQQRRNDLRADPIREVTHGSGMVAVAPSERRRPLVLVPSARHEITPLDRRRPGGRGRRRRDRARGHPRARPRSASARDAEPADRHREREPVRPLRSSERLPRPLGQRRGRPGRIGQPARRWAASVTT